MGRRDRAVEVDAAAGVLDHGNFEPRLARILSGKADAEIERQAGDENSLQLALAQIAEQTGRRLVVVLEQRRIGIDPAAETLADHEVRAGDLELPMEFGAGCA